MKRVQELTNCVHATILWDSQGVTWDGSIVVTEPTQEKSRFARLASFD